MTARCDIRSMKKLINTVCIAALAALPGIAQEHAPLNELAFQLGGIASLTRTDSPRLSLGAGLALETNYARRVAEFRNYAIYGEVHFLASPLRNVTSDVAAATRDVASLYVTPGVRLKFAPLAAISPYLAVGGGLAWYEQSTAELSGQANTAPRELLRGAVDFGAGADFRVRRWLALRAEIRDFYTGAPAYNIASSGGQHNIVAGAAFTIRWH